MRAESFLAIVTAGVNWVRVDLRRATSDGGGPACEPSPVRHRRRRYRPAPDTSMPGTGTLPPLVVAAPPPAQTSEHAGLFLTADTTVPTLRTRPSGQVEWKRRA